MGRRVLYHRATRFPQLFDLCAHSVTSAATPWTVARQAPLSLGILQAKILEWVACPPPEDLRVFFSCDYFSLVGPACVLRCSLCLSVQGTVCSGFLGQSQLLPVFSA